MSRNFEHVLKVAYPNSCHLAFLQHKTLFVPNSTPFFAFRSPRKTLHFLVALLLRKYAFPLRPLRNQNTSSSFPTFIQNRDAARGETILPNFQDATKYKSDQNKRKYKTEWQKNLHTVNQTVLRTESSMKIVNTLRRRLKTPMQTNADVQDHASPSASSVCLTHSFIGEKVCLRVNNS